MTPHRIIENEEVFLMNIKTAQTRATLLITVDETFAGKGLPNLHRLIPIIRIRVVKNKQFLVCLLTYT